MVIIMFSFLHVHVHDFTISVADIFLCGVLWIIPWFTVTSCDTQLDRAIPVPGMT